MWYSAFSLRSPSSRAAMMRRAMSRRASPSRCASSAFRASRPSAVIASPSLIRSLWWAGRCGVPHVGQPRALAEALQPPRGPRRPELGQAPGVRALVVDERDVERPLAGGAVLGDDLEQ